MVLATRIGGDAAIGQNISIRRQTEHILALALFAGLLASVSRCSSCWMDGVQPCHFCRQIRNGNAQATTQEDGFLCGVHDWERALGSRKVRPRLLSVCNETRTPSVNQTGIAQRVADVHQAVAVPAIQMITPCLSGWIEAHPTFLLMMRTLLLLACCQRNACCVCCLLFFSG